MANSSGDGRNVLTSTDFLHELQRRGAMRICHVRFRDNRSTVWSLTQDGTVLNVHAAYRRASPNFLDAFATLAIEGGIGSASSLRAARTISRWPELKTAIREARERQAGRHLAGSTHELPHRTAPPGLMKGLGYGAGYRYVPAEADGVSDQEYLPEVLRGERFYEPGRFGFEKTIEERLRWWADRRGRLSSPPR